MNKNFTPVKHNQRLSFSKNKNRGLTLIELLIVIGVIAILAAGVIVAINPGRQFAQARDATRRSHINTLHNGLVSYQVSNNGNLSGLPLEAEPTEICNTNLDNPNCPNLIVLSDLVDEGHINQIPVDPQGSVSEAEDGTGYFISDDGSLVADKAEIGFIGVGITEDEYSGGGAFACGNDLTDDRDGQTYATVDINGQCWMAENMNYDNGCYTTSDTDWTDGTYSNCTHNTDLAVEEYRTTYGLLYQWLAAMDGSTSEGSQGICPSGWHIPTDAEWHALEDYLTADGNTCDSNRNTLASDCDPAGGALKEAGTTHWNSESCGTTTCNSSGFTALPAGYVFDSGSSAAVGSYNYLWTSLSSSSTDSFRRSISNEVDGIIRDDSDKAYGMSVRCLKD